MRTTYARPGCAIRSRIAWPVLMPVLVLLLSALFLAGCASSAFGDGAPKGYAGPIEPLYGNGTTINRVQSWQPIASDVAASARKALEDRPDLMDKPIYMPPPLNRGSFATVFFNLLKTELVSRGLQVANLPEENNVDMNFSLYRVRNDSSSRRPFDVVIVVRMAYHNRYVMYKSGAYFIPKDASRIFVTTDNGFIGGNFLSGEQPQADDVWSRYAMRTSAFGGASEPTVFIRRSPWTQSAPSSTSNISSTTETFVLQSSGARGMVTQEEINNSTGRRIDPNAPPTPFPSFRK